MKKLLLAIEIVLGLAAVPLMAPAAHATTLVHCDIMDNRGNFLHWDFSLSSHDDSATEVAFTRNAHAYGSGASLWHVAYDNPGKVVVFNSAQDPNYHIAYYNKLAVNPGQAAPYYGHTSIGTGQCSVASQENPQWN
jgi:hypothetical protein